MYDWPSFALCFFFNKNIFIDRAIGAPGHGKYLVGGLNACEKQHLKLCMKRINKTHEGDKDRNINPYLIYIKNWYQLLMNVEDIVWKDDNLYQRWYQRQKKGVKCSNQVNKLLCDRC